MRLSRAEIARYMRMGREVPEGELARRMDALLPEALAAMSPKSSRARLPVSEVPLLNESERLAKHLGNCDEVFLVCATIGAEFDAWQRRVSVLSGLDALIAQAIGAAAVERLMDEIEGEIRKGTPDIRLISRYSPGYGDYPLAANDPILERLDAPRRLGVSATVAHLLAPLKSVTAVIGVAR